MGLTSLRFSINGSSYQQVIEWQREIDLSVLRHQIDTRGQALVIRRDGTGSTQKINELPDINLYEPYYGAQGCAYRYSFHPLNGACELEVLNQMGGFAFYYPQRFDPLHLYLFQPPEEIDLSGDDSLDPLLDERYTCLYAHMPAVQAMHFFISPPLYTTFQEWPWSRRPLHAYDFVFHPCSQGSQVSVRARESGVLLELTQKQLL